MTIEGDIFASKQSSSSEGGLEVRIGGAERYAQS
jgi:hypothetical protein